MQLKIFLDLEYRRADHQYERHHLNMLLAGVGILSALTVPDDDSLDTNMVTEFYIALYKSNSVLQLRVW